ncbi:tRNA lysidine(34) synthetase TilS [Nitrosomonas sp. ANs5]|uniref:tRNA lysidine(34) synthetase TilS n=1 Tax=Nitrosomonas sp. ANs5 TaxID=3423941 RepID=UPI003D33C1A0
MANSRSSHPSSITDYVQRNLCTQVQAGEHLVVALSGGVDSVVLLDLLAKISPPMGLKLSAAHVEHGISPHAGQWSAFCQTLCDKLGIPLVIYRLQICKRAQESLEAAARQARYQAFEQIQADCIALAQHQDDQAETLLLQLLRGAGVKGLSAMPRIRPLKPGASIRLLRPLLDISRSAILNYARQQNLSWITDESNSDTRFDRNFLRHCILPLLEQRYPACRKTIARASQHLGEAFHLLDELAQVDAQTVVRADKIQLAGLRSLSLARAKNLLRYLLAQHMVSLPSTAKLEEILRQLYGAQPDTRLRIVVDTLEIRCYRGHIEFLRAHSASSPITPVTWQGEQWLHLSPPHNKLEFTYQSGTGIDPGKLAQQTVTIRSRIGGERFQPDCRRPRRSLKKILQEAALPPWKRGMLPLLFCGEQLVWAAGIGVDCSFQAQPGQTGLVVTWHTHQTT